MQKIKSCETLAQTFEKIDGAYAHNTLRAYRADMEEFIRYCEPRGECALPASPETVAVFLMNVTGTGPKSATIRRKVSSISALHRLSNLPDPTKHTEVRIAVRKMHRRLGRNAAQAYGVTNEILRQLLAATGQDLRGVRDRALLLLAYDTLRRRSELVSLRIEDLEWLTAEGASILLRRSKTDQEGVGKWLHLSDKTLIAVEDWLAVAGIRQGFVLRGVTNRNIVTEQLGAGQVARIFKRLARTAGLAASVVLHISGHSLRVGGAQDLLVLGASLPQIMVKGGWTDTASAMRYLGKVRTKFGPDAVRALA